MAETFTLGAGQPVLAIDIGGTEVKRGYVDAAGNTVELEPLPTPVKAGVGAVIAQIVDTLQELPFVPAAISVVAPGIVHTVRGTVEKAANLGWESVPVRALLTAALQQKQLEIPIYIGHDVATAGYAEWQLGAANGVRNCVVLTIGTGIAAALFSDGKQLRSDGYAGEVGHMQVPTAAAQNLLCACGATGCLETVAASAAIARRYSLASGTYAPGSKEVFAAAACGDKIAAESIDLAITALAECVCTLNAILGTEKIVLAGGIVRAGETFIEPLKQKLNSRFAAPLRKPEIVIARLGARAGLVGSALRARELAAQKAGAA